ncbi:MAG: ferrochelatase [Candidatus Promineifilaceae bacterium]|nr:ferrochelatase [Candidatus Promineifilaceae bacterium]
MDQQASKTAVILLAYGGPESLEDIPDYLLDIRGGRETPQKLIDEISERYELIGSRSPLLDITRRAAAKLERRVELPVYVGMRHWSPYIADVVAEMAADGVERLIAICMAPHYSMLSIGKYREKLDEAIQAAAADTGRQLEVIFIESWHTQPTYLQALADNVRQTLLRWPEEHRDQVKIIFTAHSLPTYILERGDPYDAQLRETAQLLAERLELPAERWQFTYQSAAQTGVPWLGPQIEDLVADMAAEGERDLLIAPIGFIADHVEVLYDIDIGVAEIASEHEARIERPPMLNDSDQLVQALGELVQASLASVPDEA